MELEERLKAIVEERESLWEDTKLAYEREEITLQQRNNTYITLNCLDCK